MDNFDAKMKKDFDDMREDVDREMTSRFDHQDELIDDVSKFITTFQNTLKVVGNNEPNKK